MNSNKKQYFKIVYAGGYFSIGSQLSSKLQDIKAAMATKI